jgi:hypothetical protein
VHLAAEIVESAHQPQDDFGAVAAGEAIGAKIAVRGPVFQHVIGGGEHRCSYGEVGLLGAAARTQAMELGLQIGVFDGLAPLTPGGALLGPSEKCPAVR